VATAEPPDKRSDEAKKSRWKEPSERKGRNEGRGGKEEAGMRERRARKRKRKKKREKEKEGMIGREREGQRGAR